MSYRAKHPRNGGNDLAVKIIANPSAIGPFETSTEGDVQRLVRAFVVDLCSEAAVWPLVLRKVHAYLSFQANEAKRVHRLPIRCQRVIVGLPS